MSYKSKLGSVNAEEKIMRSDWLKIMIPQIYEAEVDSSIQKNG